jgi:chaperonin cofactor prefoldin
MDNKLDFVQYLRQWASVNPDDQVIKDLHKAADEIERLRMTNTELEKMFKQVGVVAEIWQKTEDELIELHHGKCAEQFAKQHDEIERLRAIIQDIANAVTDEGRSPAYHRQQVNYVRTMWNPLWQAISKAVKEASRD